MKLGGGGGSGGSDQQQQQQGHRPGQSDLVLVFVVGGIGMDEARQVHQEVGERGAAAAAAGGDAAGAAGTGGPKVLLGGTALVSPLDVCRQLIKLA